MLYGLLRCLHFDKLLCICEQSGLLVVSPGFSHVVAEEAQVLHYDTEVSTLITTD
jgi:hypothetical protein